MLLGDKTKAAWPLRTVTLKQQAMITRQSGEQQASLKPALLSREFCVPSDTDKNLDIVPVDDVMSLRNFKGELGLLILVQSLTTVKKSLE